MTLKYRTKAIIKMIYISFEIFEHKVKDIQLIVAGCLN